jgi:hypothetical protein
MTNRISRRAIACALLATTSLPLPTLARAATPAPQFTAIDQNGVDVTTALPFVSLDEGGIGSGPGALHMRRTWAAGAGWADNWTGGLFSVGTKYYVQLGGMSDVFTLSGGVFTPTAMNGSSLVILGNGDYLYTAREGTKVEFLGTPFSRQDIPCAGADVNTCRVPLTIIQPSGLKFSFTYDTGLTVFKRLASVSSSAGYSLTIAYTTNNPGSGSQPVDNWYQRTSVTFDNSANHPSPLPAISYNNSKANEVDVTDPAGRVWVLKTQLSGGQLRLTQIQNQTTGRNLSYNYAPDGTVQTVARTALETRSSASENRDHGSPRTFSSGEGTPHRLKS